MGPGSKTHLTVGKLDDLRPAVNLRAGAYGYFLPIQWSEVFAGDASHVIDVNVQPR